MATPCIHEWDIATLKSEYKAQKELTSKDFHYMKEDLKNATSDIKYIKNMIEDFIQYAKENYVNRKEYENKCQNLEERQIQLDKYITSQNIKLAFFWWIVAVLFFVIDKFDFIISLLK